MPPNLLHTAARSRKEFLECFGHYVYYLCSSSGVLHYIYRRLNARPVKRTCFSGLVARVGRLGASGFKTSCERLLLSKLSQWVGINTRTEIPASIFINMTCCICISVFCLSAFLMEAQGTYGPYLRNHNQLYGDRQISHFTPNMPVPGHSNSINFGAHGFNHRFYSYHHRNPHQHHHQRPPWKGPPFIYHRPALPVRPIAPVHPVWSVVPTPPRIPVVLPVPTVPMPLTKVATLPPPPPTQTTTTTTTATTTTTTTTAITTTTTTTPEPVSTPHGTPAPAEPSTDPGRPIPPHLEQTTSLVLLSPS